MTTDKEFAEYINHEMKMRRLTKDKLVTTYLQFEDEINKCGWISFTLRGALQWKSESGGFVNNPVGNLRLRSGFYDANHKNMSEFPFMYHQQNILHLFENYGGISINLKNDRESKDEIESAIRNISLLCNLLSMHFRCSLTWYPARYLKVEVQPPDAAKCENKKPHYEWQHWTLARSQEEATSSVVNDQLIQSCFVFYDNLLSVPDKNDSSILRTAIDWHAQANNINSGLNRFLNYWASIELLAHYFFKNLPAKDTGRLSKQDEKRDEIMKLIDGKITRSNCMEIITKCMEIHSPTARTPTARIKIDSLLKAIGKSDIHDKLFGNKVPFRRKKKSLKDLRDDIAHGNYSNDDRDFVQFVNDKLSCVRELAVEVILATIEQSKK